MKKKVLCVCNGGNCRSVALAEVLKGVFNYEAVAIGTFWFSRESTLLFCRWADLIIPVEPLDAQLPIPDINEWKRSAILDSEFDSKRKVINFGPDQWGHTKWEEIKAIWYSLVKDIV